MSYDETQEATAQLSHERIVIGSILTDADSVIPVIINMGARAEWFLEPRLASCWTILDGMYAAGKAIDLWLMLEQTRGEIPPGILEQCVDAVTTVAHAEHHAAYLLHAYERRYAITLAKRNLSTLEASTAAEAADMFAPIADAWLNVGNAPTVTIPLAAIGADQINQWEVPKPEGRVMWPLERLNQLVGGLEDELVYLCAGESVGKTALVLQMLRCNRAMKGALASLESSRARLVPRLVGQIARINTLSLKLGKGNPLMFKKARDAAQTLDSLPFTISDTPMDLERLTAWGRMEIKRGAKYLVVDNTRHIRTRQAYRSPVEQMRDVSIRLKALRDDVGVPVVVLHHSNADGDVSWSKDLRRDADILMFLRHNEDESRLPDEDNGYVGHWVVDCVVDKNRDGNKGFAVQAVFEKEIQTFVDKGYKA
jgi:replicative DNA helicase